MRLKRLQLLGFKSFADRTSLEFGVQTLTGIVGPNGCGKSNVVDSIRWVLGEQRPTSMRGAEMTDVIFKGSASRPPLSVAEVTLILDNGSGKLEGRGAEVSITRRVFKSGEGEYLLDGDRVRLKDVREMLFDTGLGSRGYSVLEQGKIDAVLSANPLERRRIFEEAAGISRYRQRKVETELRLKRVADDVARVEDVLAELSTRVRSLKIQAGKAERWTTAHAEWAEGRTALLKHRAHAYASELAALLARARALDETCRALRTERDAAEADVSVREGERAALSAQIERLVHDAARLAGDGRTIDERRAQLGSRVASWRATARDEGERAQRLASALAERRDELDRGSREVASLAQAASSAIEAARASAQALSRANQRQNELRSSAEERSRRALTLLQARTQAENRILSLEAARGPAAEQREKLGARLQTAQGGLASLRGEETDLATRAADTARAQSEQEELRKRLAQRMNEVAATVSQADAEKKNLELERARVQSKIDVLLARERDFEELSTGAKKVLEGVEKRGEPVAASELHGLLADHLRTDTKHARALDAALGQRAGALVASGTVAIEAVLGWLDKRQAGQVGLVVREGLSQRAPLGDVPRDERVVGPLLERVRASAGAEKLADLLVGDVLVAESLAAALDLVARFPRWRFVTLDGQLVDAAGVHGGHRALTQGAVGRRSSAAELADTVAQLSREIEALDEKRAGCARERVALQKDWERSSQELEARRAARVTAESALHTARARLRDQEAGLRALEHESGAAGAEIVRLERDLEAARAKREELVREHDAATTALGDVESERTRLEEERAELARTDAGAQVEAARARTEHEGLVRHVRELERAVADLETERERAARLAGESASYAEKAEAEIETLAAESARILEQRGAIDAQLSELRLIARDGEQRIERARARLDQLVRELERGNAELADVRLHEQRVQLAREDVVRRAQEDLSIEPGRLLEDFTPDAAYADAAALDALDADVRERKARLDKIGPVNVEAVQELAEASGRHDFLAKQRDDLAAARKTLEETIATIDGESKRLFMEAFEQVRINFQRIFRQLFGGGKADVELEQGVDPLDAGVEIVARPPGRELLPIGLLSGGQRTLTALALLFAVFEARPSPFCILDEVDAALDDANVERFLGMLDGFRQTTQFVIVTHNKGTMAACEGLYGITMETKGVSRHVSVELSEVDRWAARAQGGTREQASAREARTIDTTTGLAVVEIVPQAAPNVSNGNGANGSHGANGSNGASDHDDAGEKRPSRRARANAPAAPAHDAHASQELVLASHGSDAARAAEAATTSEPNGAELSSGATSSAGDDAEASHGDGELSGARS